MRVRLDQVQKGRRGEALGATSLSYRSGRATLAVAETEQRPTVLGLIASGRMRPDAGTVALDEATDRRAHNALRRRGAPLHPPGVRAPAPHPPGPGGGARGQGFSRAASRPPAGPRAAEGAATGVGGGVVGGGGGFGGGAGASTSRAPAPLS